MRPQTEFRLAMLRNGFAPVLNDCKRSVEQDWPRKAVNEAEIVSWDRSALLSTGMRVDGDLAVIDVDVSEAALVEELAGTLDGSFPQLFARGLVRHAGGVKEAWIVRTEEPFARLASRRWYRGGDPDDAAVAKHHVECFGSRTTRQFAVDGPHAKDRNGVVSTYQFAAGASPASVPRAELPVLPQAAFGAACDRFDGIAQAAGLKAVGGACRGAHGASDRCFELDAGTVVETADYGTMTIVELERFVRARRAHANAGCLRCSGSFHDPTRVRTDSHLIGWGRYGLSIHDCMTGVTWHRREKADAAELFEFLGQLREKGAADA